MHKLSFRMLDVRRLRVLRELAARGTIAATAEAALEATTTQVAGVLRCAAFASAHRVLLPKAIATLATRHPDLRVTTRDMEPEDSLPALKLGELDLVLAQEYAFAPNPPDPALERTELLDDPVRLALPHDHPRANDEQVAMAALDAEPWIAGREGSFCHLVVIHSTRAAGYEPRIAHITNDFDVSYALVAAGAGVGLVPELAGPPPPGVVVRPVTGAPPSRRIYAAVRAGSGARPAIAAMLAALTER